MALKLYVDRLSQPSRAVLIFCKANRIEFEEFRIDLAKRDHLRPEFKAINPLGKVPAIVDGRFKLFESHAILIYLVSAFPGVADHWYPADLHKRAKIHAVLDWHHSNLRLGADVGPTPDETKKSHKWLKDKAPFALNTVLGPALGLPLDPKAAAEAERILASSLSKIERVWLQGNGKFLLGSGQPSIADLSLVCEIMQLEMLHEEDRKRVLGPHKKILQWIEDTRNALSPHFEDAHAILFKAKARLHKLPTAANYDTASSVKSMLISSKL